MKRGIAGEPSLPLSVISSAFSHSLQSGPNLLPAHLIPPVLCLQTLVASLPVQVYVPLIWCHLLHVWCCLSAPLPFGVNLINKAKG